MKKYRVIYNFGPHNYIWRSSKDLIPTVSSIINSNYYVVVQSLLVAEDLDDAYKILNIHHPTILVNKINELAAENDMSRGVDQSHYPTLHTSMSVNDILVDITDDLYEVYYLCDSCGWKRLE